MQLSGLTYIWVDVGDELPPDNEMVKVWGTWDEADMPYKVHNAYHEGGTWWDDNGSIVYVLQWFKV